MHIIVDDLCFARGYVCTEYSNGIAFITLNLAIESFTSQPSQATKHSTCCIDYCTYICTGYQALHLLYWLLYIHLYRLPNTPPAVLITVHTFVQATKHSTCCIDYCTYICTGYQALHLLYWLLYIHLYRLPSTPPAVLITVHTFVQATKHSTCCIDYCTYICTGYQALHLLYWLLYIHLYRLPSTPPAVLITVHTFVQATKHSTCCIDYCTYICTGYQALHLLYWLLYIHLYRLPNTPPAVLITVHTFVQATKHSTCCIDYCTYICTGYQALHLLYWLLYIHLYRLPSTPPAVLITVHTFVQATKHSTCCIDYCTYICTGYQALHLLYWLLYIHLYRLPSTSPAVLITVHTFVQATKHSTCCIDYCTYICTGYQALHLLYWLLYIHLYRLPSTPPAVLITVHTFVQATKHSTCCIDYCTYICTGYQALHLLYWLLYIHLYRLPSTPPAVLITVHTFVQATKHSTCCIDYCTYICTGYQALHLLYWLLYIHLYRLPSTPPAVLITVHTFVQATKHSTCCIDYCTYICTGYQALHLLYWLLYIHLYRLPSTPPAVLITVHTFVQATKHSTCCIDYCTYICTGYQALHLLYWLLYIHLYRLPSTPPAVLITVHTFVQATKHSTCCIDYCTYICTGYQIVHLLYWLLYIHLQTTKIIVLLPANYLTYKSTIEVQGNSSSIKELLQHCYIDFHETIMRQKLTSVVNTLACKSSLVCMYNPLGFVLPSLGFVLPSLGFVLPSLGFVLPSLGFVLPSLMSRLAWTARRVHNVCVTLALPGWFCFSFYLQGWKITAWRVTATCQVNDIWGQGAGPSGTAACVGRESETTCPVGTSWWR